MKTGSEPRRQTFLTFGAIPISEHMLPPQVRFAATPTLHLGQIPLISGSSLAEAMNAPLCAPMPESMPTSMPQPILRPCVVVAQVFTGLVRIAL